MWRRRRKEKQAVGVNCEAREEEKKVDLGKGKYHVFMWRKKRREETNVYVNCETQAAKISLGKYSVET